MFDQGCDATYSVNMSAAYSRQATHHMLMHQVLLFHQTNSCATRLQLPPCHDAAKAARYHPRGFTTPVRMCVRCKQRTTRRRCQPVPRRGCVSAVHIDDHEALKLRRQTE
jgi:hypothetical protein